MEQQGDVTASNNAPASTKTNKKPKVRISFIFAGVMTIFAVAGLGFSIYEMNVNKKLSSENSNLTYQINNIDFDRDDTPYKDEDEQDSNKAYSWSKDVMNEALSDVDPQTYFYDSTRNFASFGVFYKPAYMMTVGVLSEHMSYESGLLVEGEEDTLNNIAAKIVSKMEQQGFERITGFQNLDGNDVSEGYYSSQKDIICRDITILSISGSTWSNYGYRLRLICGQYSKTIPEEGSYLAEKINQFAEAYKAKIGTYPSYINNIYTSIYVYGSDGSFYEIVDLSVSQRPTFFYRKGWDGEWKFTGFNCDDLETEEENKLFICATTERYIEIRGGF